ncbi:MAG: ParA family protein [Bacilli bacterium]
MSKVISVVSQKGGVGKTTSTINLAASLVKRGKKVLIIDIDPQGNATTGVGIDRSSLKLSVYDLLVNDEKANKVIRHTKVDNLDILPTKIDLAGADIELVNTPKRDVKLKLAIAGIKSLYDYILIDCPPSLGLLTLNALSASNSVIIPVQCEYYALEGLTQLLATIMRVQKSINKTLEIEGVLLTMLDLRTNLGMEVVEEVKVYFKSKVFKSIVPRAVRISEAPAYGLPITEYDISSKGAKAYLSLAKEVIENNE